MLPFIARVNEIRRENPALQHLSDIAWLDTANESLIAYIKTLGRQPRSSSRSTSTRTTPRRAASRSPRTSGCRRPSGSPICSRASASTGASARTTSASTRGRARRTSCGWTAHEHPQRSRPLVRGRAALVQDGGLLRDPHARVLRRQRRRLGRLPRADREARLPPVARRRLHLDAAVLRLAAARRRLRHRRLLHDPARLRHGRRRARLHRGRPPARHARDRRPRHEPHVERPSVVPGVALQRRRPQARLVRLVRHPAPLRRGADHLHRHRGLQLDVGRPGRRLLLAPLLLPPARPELRQPGGPGRADRGAALLARPRHGRVPARRRALPLRARRDERREPAGDARLPQARPRGDRRELPGPGAARRGEPVAGRRRRVLRRGRRVPHGVPLPRHAADVHGAAARDGAAGLRDPRPDARRSPATASGACSCATTTS